MICSLDRKYCHPFHAYGLYNDDYSDIVEVIKSTYELLWENNIKLRIVAADGGRSCRKALKMLLENPVLIKYKLLPFTDADHLIKTVRNKLSRSEIKCNNKKLDWSILEKLWRKDKELQLLMDFNSFYPEKDKMRSDWMRQIMFNDIFIKTLC